MFKKLIFLISCISLFLIHSPAQTATEENALYPVVQNGKWGYIDKTGTLVIKPQFDKADMFHEGLAPIQLGKRVGYIDLTGKIVINPQFDDGWEFINGVAAVKVEGKLGYIDKTGKFIWNPIH